MAVDISATMVPVWPPRVTLSVTGLTIGDVVTINRVTSGSTQVVRGADAVTVTDTALLAVDAELPFGVSVTYNAIVNNSLAASAGPATYTLTGSPAVLSDAISGQAVGVTLRDWPETKRDRPSSIYPVGGRTVVVAGDRGMFAARVTVETATDADRVAMNGLLSSTTDGVLQLRQDGGLQEADCYIAVQSDVERRLTDREGEQRRTWTLDVVEVEAWAPAFPTLGFTFGDFSTAYSGLTFADFDTDFAGQTFLQFDLVDWS